MAGANGYGKNRWIYPGIKEKEKLDLAAILETTVDYILNGIK